SRRVEAMSASVCSSRREASVSSAVHDSRFTPKLSRISSRRRNTSRPTPPPETGLMRKARRGMTAKSLVEVAEDAHQREVLGAAEPFAQAGARGPRGVVLDAQAVALQAEATRDVERARQMIALAD